MRILATAIVVSTIGYLAADETILTQIRMDLVILLCIRGPNDFHSKNREVLKKIPNYFQISNSFTRLGLMYSNEYIRPSLGMTDDVNLFNEKLDGLPFEDGLPLYDYSGYLERLSPTLYEILLSNGSRPQALRVLIIIDSILPYYSAIRKAPEIRQELQHLMKTMTVFFVYPNWEFDYTSGLDVGESADFLEETFRGKGYYFKIKTVPEFQNIVTLYLINVIRSSVCNVHSFICHWKDDSRRTCVGDMLTTSYYITSCPHIGDRNADITCTLEDCEATCDLYWPWDDTASCDCVMGRHRVRNNPFKMFFQHCPNRTECATGCESSTSSVTTSTTASTSTTLPTRQAPRIKPRKYRPKQSNIFGIPTWSAIVGGCSLIVVTGLSFLLALCIRNRRKERRMDMQTRQKMSKSMIRSVVSLIMRDETPSMMGGISLLSRLGLSQKSTKSPTGNKSKAGNASPRHSAKSKSNRSIRRDAKSDSERHLSQRKTSEKGQTDKQDVQSKPRESKQETTSKEMKPDKKSDKGDLRKETSINDELHSKQTRKPKLPIAKEFDIPQRMSKNTTVQKTEGKTKSHKTVESKPRSPDLMQNKKQSPKIQSPEKLKSSKEAKAEQEIKAQKPPKQPSPKTEKLKLKESPKLKSPRTATALKDRKTDKLSKPTQRKTESPKTTSTKQSQQKDKDKQFGKSSPKPNKSKVLSSPKSRVQQSLPKAGKSSSPKPASHPPASSSKVQKAKSPSSHKTQKTRR